MSTPPSKRARLANGSHHDEHSRSGRSDHDRHARRRSRSRDKWRERDRERDSYRNRDADYGRTRRRERSMSRDRHRSRRGGGGRSRSPTHDRGERARSPHRSSRTERSRDRRGTPDRNDRARGSRRKASPPSKGTGSERKDQAASRSDKKNSDVVMNGTDEDDEQAAMARLMGFSNFRSTKNTKVPGNDKNYGIRKGQMTVYRQYMNRVGGFNRPLSPS